MLILHNLHFPTIYVHHMAMGTNWFLQELHISPFEPGIHFDIAFMTFPTIHLQSWAIYLEQNRESSKTGQEKKSFISTFACSFGCYCQSLISGKETGHWVMFPPKFEIFLIFPYFVRSLVVTS